VIRRSPTMKDRDCLMHARIGMPSAPNRQVETRVGSLQGILSFETRTTCNRILNFALK
jgi:hypothetical protein